MSLTHLFDMISTLLHSCNISRLLFLFLASINVEENTKKRKAKELQLIIGSLGHAALVFVNKKPVGNYPI